MDEQISDLFLQFSVAKLQTMTESLTACLNRLSDQQIWARNGAHENAIGNLLLHLCGNMRQWVLHGIRGDADVRVRDEEFLAEGGIPRADLLAQFNGTLREVQEVIANLGAQRLTERIVPQGKEIAVLDAIYQVVGHVQQHTGQVILLTKQLTGADLDLTMPRAR